MQIPGALEYNFGVDILSELKSVTTDRFTIENDAKCAALCEVTYGSLKGTSVGAVCIIGTGIGGGVTIGDNVLTGSNGFAGEFSYFSTNWRDYEGFNSKWAVENSSFTELLLEIMFLLEVMDLQESLAIFQLIGEIMKGLIVNGQLKIALLH